MTPRQRTLFILAVITIAAFVLYPIATWIADLIHTAEHPPP